MGAVGALDGVAREPSPFGVSLAKLFGFFVGPRVHPLTPHSNCPVSELDVLQPTNGASVVNAVDSDTKILGNFGDSEPASSVSGGR